ncbi:MAG TPA: class I SAM-dependent methyltransferase [Gemmatales bacterium]|nr:class I SAM-dependent methyltransferase [Gemmatales bacterium]
MPPIDPYSLKSIPKWHPRRLYHTALARLEEWKARQAFDQYALPRLVVDTLPALPDGIVWSDTQVSPEQLRHLLWALQQTEGLGGTVVEIGCWRGVTTAALAQHTQRPVVGIDCFIGSANQVNRDHFVQRLAAYPHASLLEKPSGAAARAWDRGPISFIFIDADHDYWNVAHDINAWLPHVMPGGMIALHDTDLKVFAGSRRAVYEVHQQLDLVAHPENLTIFRKPAATAGNPATGQLS